MRRHTSTQPINHPASNPTTLHGFINLKRAAGGSVSSALLENGLRQRNRVRHTDGIESIVDNLSPRARGIPAHAIHR